MQSLLPTVKIYGTRPEMETVHGIVCSVFDKHKVDCIVTSAIDGVHGKRSLHPVGLARDYRSKHLDRHIKHSILIDLRFALNCCDVLLEDEGGDNEHFHVEFDPKYEKQFQEDKSYYKTHGKWPN